MKTKLLIALFFVSIQIINAQSTTSIPDVKFEEYLIQVHIDSDGEVNGKVLNSDINNIEVLYLSNHEGITNLSGIGGFSSLKTLSLQYNYIANVDLSNNANLEVLSISNTQTSTVNISQNLKLKTFRFYDEFESLTSLNLTKNVNLTHVNVSNTKLTTIDVSKNINLIEVLFYGNKLTTLDVSKNTKLVELDVQKNQLTNLDISKLTDLEELYIYDNNLTQLDLSNNTKLTHLDVQNNKLSTIDLTSNTNLRFVRLQENELTFVNIKNGNNTNISVFRSINNPDLKCIKVDNKTFSNNSSNWGKDATSRFSEECNPQTYIADSNFENYLEFKGLGNGENNDNSVDTDNIKDVTILDISDENIADLTGIEAFVSLTTLNASSNSITNIDVSKNVNLESLNIAQNPTTAIDVSKNTNLTNLNVSGNQLTSLNLTQNTALTVLDAKINKLTNVDLSKNTKLTELNIGSNKLTSLDLSKLVNLERLDCFSSELPAIDISKNKKLYYADLSGNELENLDTYGNIALGRLKVDYNKLKYLDFQNNINLVELNASFNELIGLNLKSGKNNILFNIDLKNNANLTCVEVDNVSFSTNNWPKRDAQTTFSTDCAPVNDNCSNAIPLTFGQPTPGDINSGNAANNATCVTGTVIADVWFSIIVPQTKEFSIQGSAFGGQLKFAVYDDCTATNTLACGENISLTNLTAGAKLYLKVWLETTGSNKSTNTENGTFTITAQDTSVLSVDNFAEFNNQFLVYPNPASSNFTISSENLKLENIEIYNLLGKKVFHEKVKNESKIEINTSNFSKGIYLIKIKSENKIISKKLIIK
ncbi:T9SS type A sorting domain-containing protein [Polaribacter haliotis]|uniref:T9SS type A sorting domain-containing protein n=1 Tax=Polaribacter haliotis TaxID=1888915 RepID=A0A7L8ADL1_9FLAO|nr:T9SS type A sorting domain-containing protein [Polaribacter haliotis]QOD59949.1 T9SS type A sorting domain-containing protein [Polaribacter haliotis]